MAYTNATFYLDLVNGSDSARANLVPSAYANNGSGLVRVTVGSLGSPAIVTGAVVTIAGTTGAVYDGAWMVTVIDSTHVDLQASTYSSNPAAKGTLVPFGGDSWANAWLTFTNGATAARIAPGDIIRIAKSPAPYSLGNGTWTNGPIPGTQGITSSTNATPIVVTKNAHGYVNGDVVQIVGHTTNTNANGVWIVANATANTFELQGSVGNGVGGATGTVQKINSKAVVLATAQTKIVDTCDAVWTANGTGDTTPSVVAITTDGKEGANCAKFLLDSSPQTSIMQAYKALGASTDFSAYQKLTFWIKNSAAISANQWTLTLCSDTAGATPVDTFAIRAIPSVNRWVPLTIARNGGGNLGAAIQSVAVNTGSSAPTASSNILLDNIQACTTNGLNLQSLVSKNSLEQGGTEGWYGLQSIKGTILLLDNDTNTLANAGRGYMGTTETVTTYARETIKTSMATNSGDVVSSITDSGSLAGGNIQYQGGYNTSNSAQDGETFLDGLNGMGTGVNCQSKSYLTFNLLNTHRYSLGFFIDSNNVTFTQCNNVFNCTAGGFSIGYSCFNCSFNNIRNINNNSGYSLSITGSTGNYFSNMSANNCLGYGVTGGVYLCTFNNCNIKNNSNREVQIVGGCSVYFYNCSIDGNTIGFQCGSGARVYLFNSLVGDPTEYSPHDTFSSAFVFSTKHDQTADNHWIFTDGGTWNSMATDRAGGSGLMWKGIITSSNRHSGYPLTLSLAKFALNANVQVTIKAWCKKDHATNVVGKLVVRGGQIAGVASDVVATKSDVSGTWEQLSITFTPTEKGVVEVEGWAYYAAGNSNVYFGEVSAS